MSTNGLIYWAQPIDFASGRPLTEDDLDQHEYLAKLRAFVIGAGWTVYSPFDAFHVGSNPPGGFLSAINETALDQADALIAVLPLGVTTYGVPAEIARAVVSGKPVVIVTDAGPASWTVAGWASHHNVTVYSFDTSEQAVASWISDRQAEAVGSSDKPFIFQKMDDRAQLPTRGHDDDAGYDLYTLQDTVIPPGGFVDVPTGVAADLPDGLWGMITGRSSTLRNRKILVSTGIIDNGYTGALFAGCQNLSDSQVVVLAGERVAQMILLPTSALGYSAAWGTTRDKSRGNKGFGSTGR